MPDAPTSTERFDHRRAVAWLNGWVATADEPELQWAWEAAVAIVDVYARLGVGCEEPRDGESPEEQLRRHADEQWADWFASWEEGDAHFGVHGAVQEFAFACPPELVGDQLRVVQEAWDHGWGRLPQVPKRTRRATRSAAATAPPPQPALTLIRGGRA